MQQLVPAYPLTGLVKLRGFFKQKVGARIVGDLGRASERFPVRIKRGDYLVGIEMPGRIDVNHPRTERALGRIDPILQFLTGSVSNQFLLAPATRVKRLNGGLIFPGSWF